MALKLNDLQKLNLKKICSNPITYIEKFMKVVDKNSNIVPFILTDEQRTVINGMYKFNIVLKGRQIGISTILAAYALYLTNTKSNVECLLCTDSDEHTKGVFDKLKQLYNNLNRDIRLEKIIDNRNTIEFSNHSKIFCATLSSGKDVARGHTLSFCHISELAMIKDDDVVSRQLTAISNCLTADGKLIIESTAKGANAFSELYYKYNEEENFLSKAFFFPWFEDKVTFAKEYDLYWDEYIKHYGKPLSKNDLNEYELGLLNMGATLKHLCWRKVKLLNDTEENFKQEYPSYPEEAFTSSGTSVFDQKMILDFCMSIKNTVPLSNDYVKGNLPKELKNHLNNSLTIWDMPTSGCKYYIGVDTGNGLGQDYSVCEVLCDLGDEGSKQVAEFKNNKVKPYAFADIVHALGHYYNWANVVVEQASGGFTVVDRLQHVLRYPNLYKHKRFDGGKQKKFAGFYTDSKTRPMILDNLQEQFDNGRLGINSKYLLDEMKCFTVQDGKAQAISGKHDDAVMAMSMAFEGVRKHVNYYTQQ